MISGGELLERCFKNGLLDDFNIQPEENVLLVFREAGWILQPAKFVLTDKAVYTESHRYPAESLYRFGFYSTEKTTYWGINQESLLGESVNEALIAANEMLDACFKVYFNLDIVNIGLGALLNLIGYNSAIERIDPLIAAKYIAQEYSYHCKKGDDTLEKVIWFGKKDYEKNISKAAKTLKGVKIGDGENIAIAYYDSGWLNSDVLLFTEKGMYAKNQFVPYQDISQIGFFLNRDKYIFGVNNNPIFETKLKNESVVRGLINILSGWLKYLAQYEKGYANVAELI